MGCRRYKLVPQDSTTYQISKESKEQHGLVLSAVMMSYCDYNPLLDIYYYNTGIINLIQEVKFVTEVTYCLSLISEFILYNSSNI
jgi:hypothetical protein